MAGFFVIICSQRQEVIITYGSDKWKIRSTNHKTHSYDQMSKMIVNLGSKKYYNNYKYSPQPSHLYNSLLMSIAENPEKDLSNVEGKYDTRKVCTSSVKSSQFYFFNRPYERQKWSKFLCSIFSWPNYSFVQRIMSWKTSTISDWRWKINRK